jgi:hypothetical protein
VPAEPDDQQQLHSWKQQDALAAAYERMRQRYGCADEDASAAGYRAARTHSGSSTSKQQQQQQQQQQQWRQRPGLPPGASLQDRMAALYRPSPAHPQPPPQGLPQPPAEPAPDDPPAPAPSSASWLPGLSWLRGSATAAAAAALPPLPPPPEQVPKQPRPQPQTDRELAERMLWMGEALHIARPVLYVFLLKRYGRTCADACCPAAAAASALHLPCPAGARRWSGCCP